MLIQAIILACCTFTIGNDFTAKGRRKVQDANGQYVKITPANLYSLAPQAPEDVQKSIAPLLHDEKFIKTIVEQEGLESEIKTRYENSRKLLVDYELNQLPNGGGNFVFRLGKFNDEYLMKVSGHGNRRELKTALHGMRYGSSYDKEIVTAEFLNKYFPFNAHGQPIETYQTASRIAHGLLFKQFLKECPACDGVDVVTEYLITLPGKANKIDDKSCVVLSKIEHDIQPLTPEVLKSVPVERIVALWAGMRYAGGWDINKGNVQINSKGELRWVDTEEPNTTMHPYELFNANKKRWEFNVTEEGERTLMLMLGKDSVHAQAIEEAKKLNVLESKEKFNTYIEKLKNKSNDNNNG